MATRVLRSRKPRDRAHAETSDHDKWTVPGDEETWSDVKIEFEFQAIFVGGIASTTYQVLLAHALERCPEYWVGSPRDNDLLYHLMSNIRQTLCLLKSGYSEDTRIKTVEFVLSTLSRWKTLSNFKTAEVVR